MRGQARPAGFGRRRIAGAAVILALVWIAAGVRRFPAEGSFGVLDGPALAGGVLRLERGWALAPPGLVRLTVYPRGPVELPLPGAASAGLHAQDGSRFGLVGRVRLRADAERWRDLHRAGEGSGLGGVLVSAVREAGGSLAVSGRQETVTATAERRFETALGAALAARGALLVRLDLERVEYRVAAGAGVAGPDSGEKLLVLGLDGADWQILDPLFEAGRLPNLHALAERGTRARLLSISPLLSPVVWTTIATGVEPTRHGILDFLVEDAAGLRQPVSSVERKVPVVWEMLSRAGIEVGVVGWWATWPADPVRGYLVADRVSYQLFGYRSDPADARGKSWPPGLYDEIRPLLVEPAAVGWEGVRRYLTGPRTREDAFDPGERELLRELRTLIASGETYSTIARRLHGRFEARFEAVYFEGTDTVGHLFMPYRPPAVPGASPASAESFAEVVDRYYETVDGYVGTLLAGREDWNVLVVSDHGFATDETRPRATDSRIGHGAAADWHRRFGVLILAGPAVRPGGRLDEARVQDVAPTILALFGQPVPQSWPGRVLAEALTAEFLAAHPVTYRERDPERETVAAAAADPAAADLIAKLEALGYVAGGEPGAAAGEAGTARNNAGVSLLAQGRYADAEREFRAALAANEAAEIPMLWVNLGLTLRLEGNRNEAEQWFQKALARGSTRRMAANQLALLLLDTGDLARAEQTARAGLADEPAAADLRNTLGLVLEAGGRRDEAAAEYRRAVELDPESALAANNLGNLAKGRGDLAESERWYLRAIEADPYFMGSYNNLALVYQARGEIERAIDLYDRALAKAPGNAVVLNNLGSLYFATRQLDRARDAWTDAAAADPSYASPPNNLGGLAITLGDLDGAESFLERALALDPGYGDAHINLSHVLRGRGQLDAAREQLRLAAEDPGSAANARRQLGILERLEAAAGLGPDVEHQVEAD